MLIKKPITKGLIPCGCRYAAGNRQIGQELLDFHSSHTLRVLFPMERIIASDPVDVGLFGVDGVMFALDGVSDLIE